jgi:hypothetical protein
MIRSFNLNLTLLNASDVDHLNSTIQTMLQGRLRSVGFSVVLSSTETTQPTVPFIPLAGEREQEEAHFANGGR